MKHISIESYWCVGMEQLESSWVAGLCGVDASERSKTDEWCCARRFRFGTHIRLGTHIRHHFVVVGVVVDNDIFTKHHSERDRGASLRAGPRSGGNNGIKAIDPHACVHMPHGVDGNWTVTTTHCSAANTQKRA